MNEMTSIESETIEAILPKRDLKRWAIMLSLPLLLIAIGAYFWATSGRSVSTDNAYVKQDIVAVSTQINGPVVEVFVRENQHVNAGDPLYRVDPGSAEVALLQAEAQLSAAQLQTRQLGVAAAGTTGDITGATANLAIQRRALGRQQALLKDGFTTRSAYDDAVNEVQKAETQLADARAQAANARAAIAPAGNQPQIAAARAAVARARLDLTRGLVRAPESGIVANSDRLLIGQSAITGVAMLSIVKDKAGWVEANFKEGDLAKMQVGQPATVEFRRLPRPQGARPCRVDRCRHGQRIFGASGAECQRQLGQGDPARAGPRGVRRTSQADDDRRPVGRSRGRSHDQSLTR